MKLVVDMNLSERWVSALADMGLDAVHWASIGSADADDETILAWADENRAVVLTRDLDFATLLTKNQLNSPSVVQLRVAQARPDHHLSMVREVIALNRESLERGAIITVQYGQIRVRLLAPGTET